MAPVRAGEVENVLELFSPEQIAKLNSLKTSVEAAAEFRDRTKVDSLAVAIGAIHGMTGRGSRLNFDQLEALKAKVKLPFVLHAASGIPLDQMQEACARGVCKVNVATRVSMALIQGTKERIDANPGEKDFRKVFVPAMQNIKDAVYEYIDLFGCAGKAGSGWLCGPQGVKITKESPE